MRDKRRTGRSTKKQSKNTLTKQESEEALREDGGTLKRDEKTVYEKKAKREA